MITLLSTQETGMVSLHFHLSKMRTIFLAEFYEPDREINLKKTYSLKMTFSRHDSLLMGQVRWNKKCRSAHNNSVINFH